jgi:hypothetical protein
MIEFWMFMGTSFLVGMYCGLWCGAVACGAADKHFDE